MNRDAFDQRMRALECFHDLRLLPGAWVVVRVDGRGFSRFTAPRFDKPFDTALHKLMVQTARVLLDALQGCYAYTESDEISVLCPPEWELFDRKLEKMVSLEIQDRAWLILSPMHPCSTRQGQGKSGARTGHTAHCNTSIVRRHDLLHQIQAEPRALGLGGVQGFKN